MLFIVTSKCVKRYMIIMYVIKAVFHCIDIVHNSVNGINPTTVELCVLELCVLPLLTMLSC